MSQDAMSAKQQEILEYINKMDLDPVNGDLAEAIDLVDAVNTFNGHYTSFKMAGTCALCPQGREEPYVLYLRNNRIR